MYWFIKPISQYCVQKVAEFTAFHYFKLKKVNFIWTSTEQEEFDKTKHITYQDKLLDYPDFIQWFNINIGEIYLNLVQ